MAKAEQEVTGWVGWIFFASMMMLISGGLQVIAGLVALFHKEFYVTNAHSWVVINNYTAWGWIDIALGVLVIAAALSLMTGRLWARIVACFLTVLNVIGLLAFLPAYPWWSIVGLVINGLVLYALTVHGSELEADRK